MFPTADVHEGRARFFEAWVCLLAAALFSVWVWHATVSVCFPYPLDQVEGAVGGIVENWRASGRLFGAMDALPAHPAIHVPYTPVFLSVILPWAGTPWWLAAGRCVSASAALAVAMGLFFRGRKRGAAFGCAAAALFLLLPPVYRLSALARVDMLALAFTAFAWFSYLSEGRWRFPLTVIFLSLAFWTKEFYIAAPLAMAAYEGFSGRRSGIPFAFLVLNGLGFLALHAASDGASTRHLVALQWLPMSAERAARVFLDVAVPAAPLAFLWIFLNRKLPEGLVKNPLGWYFVFSLAAGVFAAAKAGSEDHYFLECFLAMLLGVTVFRKETSPEGGGRFAFALEVAALLTLLPLPAAQRVSHTYADVSLPSSARGATPSAADRENGAKLLRTLGGLRGPLLTENAAWGLLAGRPPVCDAFQCGALAGAGRWDETPLIRMLAEKRFAAVAAESDLAAGERAYFSAAVSAAIVKHYAFSEKIGNVYVCLPRAKEEE
ncbi:MAG: hypothetical protein V1809_06370 [Planctomycetota bacterium]